MLSVEVAKAEEWMKFHEFLFLRKGAGGDSGVITELPCPVALLRNCWVSALV
jgi:hypothetical protein